MEFDEKEMQKLGDTVRMVATPEEADRLMREFRSAAEEMGEEEFKMLLLLSFKSTMMKLLEENEKDGQAFKRVIQTMRESGKTQEEIDDILYGALMSVLEVLAAEFRDGIERD